MNHSFLAIVDDLSDVSMVARKIHPDIVKSLQITTDAVEMTPLLTQIPEPPGFCYGGFLWKEQGKTTTVVDMGQSVVFKSEDISDYNITVFNRLMSHISTIMNNQIQQGSITDIPKADEVIQPTR